MEQPLITNDPMGLAKLVIAIVVGTSPIYGLVIAFLRKGPNDAIAALRYDLNGYGSRLNRVEVDRAAEQQEVGQLVIRMATSEQDREGLHVADARIEQRVSTNEQRIEQNQRAILDAAHKIELQVASLASQASVGKELRDGLDRIADIMIQRENDRRRRDGGEQQ